MPTPGCRVADMTPKDAGKKRLRMILVADRCGMNQASLFEMKHSIVQVNVACVSTSLPASLG